jgi:hypothetical protein
MHGGRGIMVDRKTGIPRTIYVPRAAVSVAGGIQPATLQRALGRAYFENGLAARLLLASPPRRVKQWTEAEIDSATETAVAKMFDWLYSLEPVSGPDGDVEPGIVRLSPQAKDAWVVFYNEHAQEQVALTGDESAAWSKLEGYVARLALLVHCVRCAAGEVTDFDTMDELSMGMGVALCRWFGYETRRVYAMLSETDVDRQRRELVELVRRLGGNVTARDLMRSSRAYRTSESAEADLNALVQGGAGHWEDAGPAAQGGRPTRRFMLVASADADRTPKALEKPGVSSAGLANANVSRVAVPAAPLQPGVDKTPKWPKKFEVPSTSAPSVPIGPENAATLDLDRPGPVDLLNKEQRGRYFVSYHSAPEDMSPAEKHALAWRAAVRDDK